jgi:hypothetical protein
MIINRLTITGADDMVNRDDLLALEKEFPFIEWGILFSKDREGTPRYPSDLKRRLFGKLTLAAHFNGWYSRQVMEENNFKLISSLPDYYQRVQINYDFSKNDKWNLHALEAFMSNYKEKAVILQYNERNARAIDAAIDNTWTGRIHFLHDNSGGRGKEIEFIADPVGQHSPHYTGYAGGINEINIGRICQWIKAHLSTGDTWIDIESGARTQNKFDVQKVRWICEIAKKYIWPK